MAAPFSLAEKGAAGKTAISSFAVKAAQFNGFS
jgi:hypothetical protein